MGALKNHPGMWMADEPAAAINALEDKYGVIRINRAGVTEAQQQAVIDQWDRGGAANRPPFLYPPARPAKTSNHVVNGGQSVDVYNYTSDRAKLNEFGFEWYGPSDPVHYTFRGRPGPASPVLPWSQVTEDRQNWLKSRGFDIQVDGREGPETRKVYADYQRILKDSMGYYDGPIDGIWGPKMQAAHQRHWDDVHRGAPASRRSSKQAGELSYADIQEALNRHGYGLKVDNVWGPASKNALADFQGRHGLKVDRIVGPATWAKLNVD